MQVRRAVRAGAAGVALILGAAGPAPGQQSRDEQELIAIEREGCRVLVTPDPAWWDAHLTDDFLGMSSRGVLSNKAQNLAPRPAGSVVTGCVDRDMKVRVYGDAAIVTASGVRTGSTDGVPYERRIFYTDTFVRKNGRWLLAGSQTSLVPPAPPPSDLAGTWEEIAIRDSAGAVDSLSAHGVNWLVFTGGHWMAIEMENGRKVPTPAEVARLPAAERPKANFPIWDAQGRQIFAARGGTYRVAGNTLVTTRVMAMNAPSVGREETFTITRPAAGLMVLRRNPAPGLAPFELTLRRID